MPTTLIIIGVLAVVQIILLIILLVMLVKQFKHGGALHGIIGLITCGFWTYIWGWIKCTTFDLTKIMIVWTILILAPVALVGVYGIAMVSEMIAIAQNLTEEGGFEKLIDDFDKKGVNINAKKKAKKTKQISKLPKKKPAKNASGEDMDWSKEAVALWKNGEYSDPNKALSYWNKAIRKNSKSAELYNNRGLAYYNLKKYQQAVKDFSQAIRMKPQEATAYNNRGNAYYEMFKYDLAETDFNKSIELNPDYASAYLNRGLVYYQLDNNPKACADFANACDLKNCDGMTWAKEQGVCS
jgi:tetratricopeptide (TPR) repeat protein